MSCSHVPFTGCRQSWVEIRCTFHEPAKFDRRSALGPLSDGQAREEVGGLRVEMRSADRDNETGRGACARLDCGALLCGGRGRAGRKEKPLRPVTLDAAPQ